MTAVKSIRNLDLSQKREVLTIDELSSTVDESLIGGDSKRIRHADFINDVSEMMDKRNLKWEVAPIHVRAGGPSNMPNITLINDIASKYAGDTPVEAHLVRNLTGKILINDLTDEISNQAIAFSFSQLGVQAAYGMNVHECSNLSIWGENIAHSYGRSKKSVAEIFGQIGDWLDLLDKKRAIDLAHKNKLDAIPAVHDDIMTLVGLMLVEANKKNMKEFKDVEEAPLNDTQVSHFAKNYALKYAKIDKFPVENMWDIYNIGTALLRPDQVNNYEPIFRQNKVLGDFIFDKFNIETVDVN